MNNSILKKIKKHKRKFFYLGVIVYAIAISPAVLIGGLLVYWDIEPPPNYSYDPILQLEHWTAVPAGDDINRQHKSNTDMIFYDGYFYLINAETKWHLEDTDGRLRIRRSVDAKNWEIVEDIIMPGIDVRDPKFANVSDRLYLYFLPNWHFDPGPNTTYYTYSDDGLNWQNPVEMKVNITYEYDNGTVGNKITGGWNFWRPKTPDNVNWYVIATGRKYSEATTLHDYDVSETISILLKSTDGENWTEVSEILTRWGNAEVCMDFLPNGEILSTHRVSTMGIEGYAFGTPHGGTIIATSYNNYKNWSFMPDFQTRLDGATLFKLNGRIFATGRNHLGPSDDIGNHLSVKRTSFYEIKADRLVWLFDLPSNGDTAYTGVVIKDGWVYTCYYTCPINKNYPWILGICFFTKTEIKMARVNATGLLNYADKIIGEI